MKRLQVWQYLLPIFTVFWVAVGASLITYGFPFLIALAILALFSYLIVGLAWAFQNNI
jgi:hypothetical protein